MIARRKQLDETFEVLVNFVRVVLALRAFRAAKVPEQTLWVVINNALLHTAAIDWCKLFGSDQKKRQPTHWRNVLGRAPGFEAALCGYAGVTKDEWDDYRKEIKKFRDNAAAHHSTTRREIKKFPRYDLALKAVQFYYERAAVVLKGEFNVEVDPADLVSYVPDFLDQSTKFARLAIGATADFAEMVDFPRAR